MTTGSGRPNAWGQPAERPDVRGQWMGNPYWTTSACLVLALLGLMPLLWMRRASHDKGLPAELAPRGWRGWTQRPRSGD